MNNKKEIRVVLVVNGKEPEVVTVPHSLDSFENLIRENLSENEKAISDVNGLDFFSNSINRISGVVEEYSACHPYERNRDWHGPAIFFEFNNEGDTISMSDKKIEELKSLYRLSNASRSTSEKINNFLDTYHKKPVIFNFSHGNFQATCNTMDYANILLSERNKDYISSIESTFDNMLVISKKSGKKVEDLLSDYLINLGKHILIIEVGNNSMFDMISKG